jgi:hypothetical protein
MRRTESTLSVSLLAKKRSAHAGYLRTQEAIGRKEFQRRSHSTHAHAAKQLKNCIPSSPKRANL